jgi:hypothetical protein
MPPLKDLIGKKPSDKKSSASEPTEIDPVGRDLMNAMLAHSSRSSKTLTRPRAKTTRPKTPPRVRTPPQKSRRHG